MQQLGRVADALDDALELRERQLQRRIVGERLDAAAVLHVRLERQTIGLSHPPPQRVPLGRLAIEDEVQPRCLAETKNKKNSQRSYGSM